MKLYNYPIVFFVLLLVLNSCTEKEPEKQNVLRPVKYTTVGSTTNDFRRQLSGTIKAADEIDLSFRSSGVITVLNISVGQDVKKGQLLAKLDNVQAELAYEQSISALSSAKSSKSTSKSNLDRVRALYEKGSTSLSDYEQAKNGYQTASDQYESALRNKSIQKTQINYGVIRAPKDGIIAIKNNELNETASPGQIIGVLNAGSTINVMVGLPESMINKTKLGMKTDLVFSALNSKKYKGTIIEIAPVVDENSATYPIKIEIDTPNKDMKPGMATTIIFDFSEIKNVMDDTLSVPLKAVGEEGDKNFVFLIKSSDLNKGKVKKQYIEIGKLSSDGFVVKSGLKTGDLIATAGLQTLLDGQEVRLK
jgi:membrane fusion protein, multidrug efflux system